MSKAKELVHTTGAYTIMRPCRDEDKEWCMYCLAPATFHLLVMECRSDKSELEVETVKVCDGELLRAAQFCNELVRLTALSSFDGLGTLWRDQCVRAAKEYRAMLDGVIVACKRLELPGAVADEIQRLYRDRLKFEERDAARATSMALDAGLLLDKLTKKVAKDAVEYILDPKSLTQRTARLR